MTTAEIHQLFLANSIVCTDTRKAVANSIFFALKGENFDANDFAKEALDRGCKYAVVDNPKFVLDSRYILVDEVLRTLQALASYHRNYCKAKILSITGTNGKTTTKELIKKILQTTYKTIATEGNLNNHIGVPLTLLRLTETTDIGIIEMGANHPKEIANLCSIADPDYGIITNVGTGHIEGFGSFEGVLNTKTELYEYVAKKNGTLFVNKDNKLLVEKAKQYECSLYTYGTADGEITAKLCTASPFLEATIEGTPIKTQLLGAYNFENILAAYTIGSYFKVSKQNCLSAIASYTAKNNRSQLLKTRHNTLILDAYNANPTSMRAAILNFAEINYPNKMLILGDMLELGHLSTSSHKEIKNLLREKKLAANSWLVGKLFSSEKEEDFLYFENAAKVIEYLQKNPLKEKQILIKGSRGIKLESLVELL